MDTNIIKGLIYNTSFLIALILLYTNFILRKEINSRVIKQIPYGVLIGLIGIGIMTNPITLSPGVFLDARTILISISALFFGYVPSVIAAIITIIFRIYEGGEGTITGAFFIVSSLFIGMYWRKKYINKLIEKDRKYGAKNLLVFGILVIFFMFFIVAVTLDSGISTVTRIFWPITLIFPPSIVFIGITIKSKIDEENKNKKISELLKEEKERYKSIFIDNQVISFIVNPENLRIIDANPAACKYYGYTHEEITKLKVYDINVSSELVIKDNLKKIKTENKGNFEVKHKLKNGKIRDVEIYIGSIRFKNKEFLYTIAFDITERKKRQGEIEYLSFYDQLTNLYNRRFFEVEMKRLDTNRNLPISIIMADVNGLKLINDAFGHKVGDELLINAAKVLKSVCRQDDIVARVGGDEFLILLPNTEIKHAREIIRRAKKDIKNIKIKNIKMSIALGMATKTLEEENIHDIYKKAEDRMYKNKLFESAIIKNQMIDTILSTIYQSNFREKEHSKSVSKLCEKVGKELNLNEDLKMDLKLSGLFHDIGKIAIDENILKKNEKLTEDEWKHIKSHCDIGYRILSAVNRLSSIAENVLYHHERFDGKGYPKGLKGKEIPFISRIVSVCNAYDAMTRDESYRKSRTSEEALEEIQKHSGTQFDPEIVKTFVKIINKKRLHLNLF